MKNLKYTSFFLFFMIFISTSCCVSKNKIGSKKGWIIVTTVKSKKPYFEFLTLRTNNAEMPNDSIAPSYFIVNGIDCPSIGTSQKLRVFSSTYKVKVSAIGMHPIEVTVHRKAGYDVFVDFHMKYEPMYLGTKE